MDNMTDTNNISEKSVSVNSHKQRIKMNKNIRFFENEYPEEGDIIMCKVKEKTDIGLKLYMIEYGNKIAFMPYTELTKRSRIRKNIKSLIKIGADIPVTVVNIRDNLDDDDKNIDVSKKQVYFEDAKKCINTYKHDKIIRSHFNYFAKTHNLDIYDLYAKTIWKIERELVSDILPEDAMDNQDDKKSCYQLLKDAINSEKKDYGIFDTFELSSDLKDKVISLLEKKLVDPPKKINAKIRITCFTCEGIDAIKEALRAGLQMSTSNIKISIQLESSPFYNIFTVTDKVSDGIKLINDCISVIERTILDKKGEFKIEHNPTVAKID